MNNSFSTTLSAWTSALDLKWIIPLVPDFSHMAGLHVYVDIAQRMMGLDIQAFFKNWENISEKGLREQKTPAHADKEKEYFKCTEIVHLQM